MLDDNDYCGCQTRKETIGTDTFWNLSIVGTALAAVLLAQGGTVSKQTRYILSIAAGGAILALSSAAIRQELGNRFGLKF